MLRLPLQASRKLPRELAGSRNARIYVNLGSSVASSAASKVCALDRNPAARREGRGEQQAKPCGPLQRCYVDAKRDNRPVKPSITDSEPVILPGSASSTAAGEPVPLAPGPIPAVSPASASSLSKAGPAVSSSTIHPKEVPLAPVPPPALHVQKSPTTSIPPPSSISKSPPPPPPPPPSSSSTPPPSITAAAPKRSRRSGRMRRTLTSIFLLTGLGYALGAYYSLVNDNFHDFFTEYIPFAEDIVFFFEERQYRRRLPSLQESKWSIPRETGNNVSIPSGSGMSWRVAQEPHGTGKTSGQPGPHNSAIDVMEDPASPEGRSKASGRPPQSDKAKVGEADKPEPPKKTPPPTSIPPAGQSPTGTAAARPEGEAPAELKPPVQKKEARKGRQDVAVEGPKGESRTPPIEPIKAPESGHPIIQDVVKIINNVITVVNAENATRKYGPALEMARSEVAKIGDAIASSTEEVVQEKLKATHEEFDQAAKELVRRVEEEMADQEARWRDDFETERKNMEHSFAEKLKTELARSGEVYERRLRNELLEQAIHLKRHFAAKVKDLVEDERDGRLGKLGELSKSVNELESLTTGWNNVVDTNLKTQRLHVAVEAVRSILDETDQPRPFVRELAALRETASDDPVVKAAIASINPAAYRYGLPSTAYLIDRFRRVASEVRKASLVPEQAGAASHAASLVLSKVLFRKEGPTAGDDVESILTRTETLLEEGDLDGAAREMNSMSGWAKTLSKDWLAEVRKVLEAQQALDVIAAEARLRSLQMDG